MHFDFITDKLSEFFEVYENGPISEKGVVQFYYCPSSTSPRFPQLSHVLLARGENTMRSPMYEYFEKHVFDFLKRKNIKHGKVMRACLNLQYAHSFPHTDPHVDLFVDHYVVILYLSDCDGDTIVYEDVYDESKNSVLLVENIPSEYPIKELISPEKGKIICFDGKHYHANYFPSIGKLRLVCVFNIEK